MSDIDLVCVEVKEGETAVALTERHVRALHNLLDTGHRVGFRAVVGRHPAELLSEPEMVDLQVRLIRALGEKQS